MPGGSIVHCPEFAYIATPIVLNVYLFTVFVRMTRSTGYSLLLLLRFCVGPVARADRLLRSAEPGDLHDRRAVLPGLPSWWHDVSRHV